MITDNRSTSDERGFILGAEDPETTVFANPSALAALAPLAPLPFGVGPTPVVCVKFSKKGLWAYGRVKLRARSGALRESSA